MTTLTLKTITLTDIARLGLWCDDPYGDGIRLDQVRNPSAARLAAIAEVAGEPMLASEELIRRQYESTVRLMCFTKRGKLKKHIERNLVD